MQKLQKYGAEVPFLRPKKFADDNSTDLDVFSHIIEWFDKNNQIPELFIHLRPSPLRDPNVLNQAIMFFKKILIVKFYEISPCSS